MKEYLPYFVTVLCAVLSGFFSYIASRRKAKADLQKLMKQHELDIEKEREMFTLEKEKMEIEHRHQLELKQKEMENQIELMQKEREGQIGTDLIATLTKEFMRTPEGRARLRNIGSKK